MHKLDRNMPCWCGSGKNTSIAIMILTRSSTTCTTAARSFRARHD
ncbi:MAG: hypothetical protein ACLUHE_09155 [Christensenellales bacterium]